MRTKPGSLLIAVVTISTIAFIGGLVASRLLDLEPQPPDIPGLLWPLPQTITDFSLRDHRGQVFDNHSLQGGWELLFFGYTYCPDVCPHIAVILANVERRLQARKVDHNDRSDTRFIFVSIDPERDTVDRLGPYVEFFNPEFLGVTGDAQKLRELIVQLGIVAVRQPADPNGHYLIDHSAALILIDPEARWVGIFQPPYDVDDLSDRIARIQTFIEG